LKKLILTVSNDKINPMNKENIGKIVLGVAGLTAIVKGQLSLIKEPVVHPNVVVKAVDDIGIPEVRLVVSNFQSSVTTQFSIGIIPVIIDTGSLTG